MTKFTIKHQDKGVPPASVEVKEATTIVLGIVLSHVAEIFEGIVGAVAEHYKIDPKEMMEVVKNHPSVTQIALHPAISDLGYMPELKEHETVAEAPPVKTKKFKIKKNTIE
jgi:hypothetical protein